MDDPRAVAGAGAGTRAATRPVPDPHSWRYLALTCALTLLFAWEFAEIAFGVMLGGEIVKLDAAISSAMLEARTAWLTLVFWVATIAGDFRVIGTATAVIALLLVMSGRRRDAAFVAVALAVGSLGQNALKLLFDRPRPTAIPPLIASPDSYSFPSGHAFGSLVFAGLVVFAFWAGGRRWQFARAGLVAAMAFFAMLVGLSRVYLGVHWMSDVIASWWLALAWLSLACGSYTTLSHYRGEPERHAAWGGPKARASVIALGAVAVAVAFALAAASHPLTM